MKLPRNLYSRLTLITCVTLITGYALVYAWTTLNPVDAGPGKPLTSTLMQAVMNNINELNTRTSNLSSNGANTGIGIASPNAELHIVGSPRSNAFVVGTTTAGSGGVVIKPEWGPGIGSVQGTRSGLDGVANLAINPQGGNVGIGTVSPSEKLDL